jgi:hypothetical protein
MDNKQSESQQTTDDRRDGIQQGSSLSGSTKRDNDATEKALHPLTQENVSSHQPKPEGETVDQDPGQRQKQNQGNEKDDPLAA